MKIIEHTYKVKPYTKRKQTVGIVLHCAATPEGKDFTVEQINEWHNKRDFNGIGYHFVIYRDGSIHRGRTEDAVGAHCVAMNNKSIGVCYIGGCSKDGKTPKDTRTDEQKQSMYELVEYLLDKYKLKITDVSGHRDFDNKACPSFVTTKFWDEFNKYKEQKYIQQVKKEVSKVNPCHVKDWFK